MTPLGEFLRSYLGGVRQGLNFFLYGVTLIVVVIVLPGGIISALHAIRRRVRAAASPVPAKDGA
jgi:ABC-type branched-subunit amino acid transport system permease subunit